MKIEDKTLIIDEPISNEQAEEFLVAVNQDEIEKIVIEDDRLDAAIYQILWCSNKKIETNSDFADKFFEQVLWRQF